jgi:hypothetical protein
MLKALDEDMSALPQLGAGYYSCIPFQRRFNKLLGQARTLFEGEMGLIDTFDELPERDPSDPTEKSAILEGIRVEIGQLVTLLEATREEG